MQDKPTIRERVGAALTHLKETILGKPQEPEEDVCFIIIFDQVRREESRDNASADPAPEPEVSEHHRFDDDGGGSHPLPGLPLEPEPEPEPDFDFDPQPLVIPLGEPEPLPPLPEPVVEPEPAVEPEPVFEPAVEPELPAAQVETFDEANSDDIVIDEPPLRKPACALPKSKKKKKGKKG